MYKKVLFINEPKSLKESSGSYFTVTTKKLHFTLSDYYFIIMIKTRFKTL